MNLNRRRLIAAALSSVAIAAHAQGAYPSRTISMVVPFPAGASTDAFARLIAQRLTVQMGQQVIVENKPGASGNIAAQYVARGPADGYRVLVATHPMLTVNPHVYRQMGFDPLKDLKPVANGINTINVIVVNPALPVKNVAELVAWAKSNPDKVFFGTAGPGTPHHIGGMELGRRAGIEMKHVPYKGGAPMLADLAGGQIPIGITALASAEELARNGKIRIIGVGEPARVSAYPDVPTLAETYPGLLFNGWTGFFVPSATPKDVTDRLTRDLLAVMNEPEVARKLDELRLPLLPERDPESLARQVAADYKTYGEQVRAMNLTVD
jgi:tripartite-type tricarboxylate transporter receptor subunit TctC